MKESLDEEKREYLKLGQNQSEHDCVLTLLTRNILAGFQTYISAVFGLGRVSWILHFKPVQQRVSVEIHNPISLNRPKEGFDKKQLGIPHTILWTSADEAMLCSRFTMIYAQSRIINKHTYTQT